MKVLTIFPYIVNDQLMDDQLFIYVIWKQTCSLHTGEEGVLFIGDVRHWTVFFKLGLQSLEALIFSPGVLDALSGL